MGTVTVTDSEEYEFAESTEGADLGNVESFEQYYLDETEFVDTGAFPFDPAFQATPAYTAYTAKYADTLEQITEMQVWSDSEYPAVTVILYNPDGTILLDATETVTFNAAMPGSTITAACEHGDAGAVTFSLPAGADPGVYRARWTVVTDTSRLSVPTLPVTLRVADEP